MPRMRKRTGAVAVIAAATLLLAACGSGGDDGSGGGGSLDVYGATQPNFPEAFATWSENLG